MIAHYLKVCVVGLLFLMGITTVFSAPAQAVGLSMSPVGYWTTIDDKLNKPRSIIRIWQRGDVYYGQIARIFKQPGDKGICSRCPGVFKNKPILGLGIIWGLRQTSDRVWSGGQILDPVDGKVYRVMLTLANDGKSLRARGYLGISLFGRTQIWYRRF